MIDREEGASSDPHGRREGGTSCTFRYAGRGDIVVEMQRTNATREVSHPHYLGTRRDGRDEYHEHFKERLQFMPRREAILCRHRSIG